MWAIADADYFDKVILKNWQTRAGTTLDVGDERVCVRPLGSHVD